MVSWPYRPDFLGEGNPPLEVPSTSADRIALMKQLSSSWADPFRSLVQSIPADAESTVINLQDWVPHRNMSRDSRVTLAGDAGHTMVMYRGEGANHALKDVSSLLHHLHPHLSPYSPSSPTVPSAIGAYESEMFGRSRLAVLASRQACLDAHEYARISEESPLISKRAVVPDYQA
ncbi:MAG: hypothetical protein M1833_005253 [Piccolia ochrophora]|nr:MAG: hypothetical protein M1833_005253 [Piccolia ochrophora]